ncbi:hypothetical protein B7C42_08310 [Nocardia cerradoensis]|uniref:Uncharacterized protein n=1 Tax=Nocardia cerradoensis TaxID=85688 RepID=A0A231GT19_9NOCA|nr:hypothetical protein B7C42_08310 [Nocardia cerradoensis]
MYRSASNGIREPKLASIPPPAPCASTTAGPLPVTDVDSEMFVMAATLGIDMSVKVKPGRVRC